MQFLRMKRMLIALSLGMGVLALGTAAQAVDISGAGATFPYPVYAKWADAYKKQTGVGLNYQSIGSGGGIKQIKAKTVTFGASDMPLKPEDLKESGLVQFPMIIGGVVPVVNIKGVKAGGLTLDGATLAAIYLGEITKWNDPRVQKLNPKVTLPATAIAPVYRSDGSGTNFLFTDYLSKASAKFKDAIGANASVQWPTGIGAKGNEGVANMTTQTDGAVGYVEYAYAKQNNMAYALMINKAAKAVAQPQRRMPTGRTPMAITSFLPIKAAPRAGRSPERASSWSMPRHPTLPPRAKRSSSLRGPTKVVRGWRPRLTMCRCRRA